MKTKILLASSILIVTFLNAQKFYIKPGWQLVGAVEDMNTTAFDQSGCVDFLWKYNPTDKWQLHISNGKQYNYKARFYTIKKWEGFWVKGKNNITNCPIDTK